MKASGWAGGGGAERALVQEVGGWAGQAAGPRFSLSGSPVVSSEPGETDRPAAPLLSAARPPVPGRRLTYLLYLSSYLQM